MNKHYYEDYISLKASAGSGKTFALSIRYIYLILNGAQPSDILALTFTNKAANEMKERIIETFLNLDKPKYEVQLNILCEILQISADEVLKIRDYKILDFLNSNIKISTFDSFFAQIARVFALQLGISANFEIGKNLDLPVNKKFYEELQKDESLSLEFVRYVLNLDENEERILQTISNLAINEFEVDKKAAYPNDIKKLIFEKLEKIKELVINIDPKKVSYFELENSDILEIKSNILSTQIYENRNYKKLQNPNLTELLSELRALYKEFFEALDRYNLKTLLNIKKTYENSRFNIVSKLNSLEFGDVSQNVYKLLRDEIDKDMLYFRIDSSIKHLLIDEFQDTDILQYETILPLIEESVSGIGQNDKKGTFFYVGDIKQSIYRFRGANKELFDKLVRDFPQIKEFDLKKNYRSAKNLVNFVNQTFEHKITNYKFQEPNESFKDGYIKIATINESLEDCVLKEIQNLLSFGVKPKDIAILCWKREDISRICERLIQADILFDAQSGNSLLQIEEIQALLFYLKYCLTKEEIYRANIEAIFKVKVRALNLDKNRSVVETLYYLANELKLDLSSLDLLKFFEISANYKNIVNFIYEVGSLNVKSLRIEENGVKIMTVFASKGLEFDNVIVCDKDGGNPINNDKFISEYKNNRWIIKTKNSLRGLVDKEYEELLNERKRLDHEDDMNKLYVAFTRAKDSLIILKRNSPNGKKPSFFTAYESNKQIVEYLDLKEQEIGKLEILQNDEIQNELKQKSPKHIELEVVAKQEVINLDEDSQTKEHKKSIEVNIKNINYGVALHYMLEMLDFENPDFDKSFSLMRSKFGINLDEYSLKDIKFRVMKLLKDIDFIGLIEGAQLFKEQPFKIDSNLKKLDLLLKKDDKLIIIDYKSSKHFIEENIKQVSGYKSALKALEPQSLIEAYIVFIMKDAIEILKV